MNRTILASAMLLLTACATTDVAKTSDDEALDSSPFGDTIGVDHVLLWSQDQTEAETYLSTQLGFRLTNVPGDYGAGIANKLIWFDNLSYMELLWLADPELTRNEAPDEFAFVSTRNGSNAYGLQVEDVDATFAALDAASLKPLEPSSETYDFDGPDGPRLPVVNQWRVMFLESGALPGNPFFVEYNLPSDASVPRSDQPNGAERISSVWILVVDVETSAARYQQAGFRARGPVEVPGVGAGIAFHGGDAEILLLSPINDVHSRRLDQYGEHVVGISIDVKSLAATRRLLEERSGPALPMFDSAFGSSVRPPALDELGLHIEFHE